MMQILITGSAGFIGSHLVKKLSNLPMKLVCVDKSPKRVDTLKMDVADGRFLEYFRHQKFDYILHFGSPCSVLQFNKNPVECMANTVDGFCNVLILAKRCDAQLIFPSSGNIYGSKDTVHSELDNPKPCNLYGKAKLRCEYLADRFTVSNIALRIYCGYGSGEEMKGYLASVLYQFLSRMMRGKSPIIWGDGLQVRDFVHIDDIVRVVLRCLTMKVSAKVNVASGVSYSYNDLVALINEVLGTNISPRYVAKPFRYVDKTYADITYMRSILGVEPKPLKEGVKQFSEYLSRV